MSTGISKQVTDSLRVVNRGAEVAEEIPKELWKTFRKALIEHNRHMKRRPKPPISERRQRLIDHLDKIKKRERREGRRPDGSLPRIPRKGVKRHGGVPRPEARAQQIEYDLKRGAYESAT